jgi:TPR repeat protein
MISEGFTDFGRWGFSEREFQNLDLESLTRKSQIEYFYLDAIESAKNGDIIALLLLGQSFAISQKIANGASLRNEYFKKAADLGSSRAIVEYAHLVERNLVPGVEPATASASYQRAIDMGDASAMVRLANLNGLQNRRDEQFALLMRAANLGHIPAMSNLSSFLAFCENEPCDYDKAFGWAKKAFDLRVGPIYPDLFLMFTGLFDDEDTSPLAQWIRLKATSDPTLNEYREIWSKAIDGMTENQLAIARPKLLALSRKSGMGAVLAAETIAMWYELDCRPQAGGDYACPPRTGYYN